MKRELLNHVMKPRVSMVYRITGAPSGAGSLQEKNNTPHKDMHQEIAP